jgi:hypothetical protein
MAGASGVPEYDLEGVAARYRGEGRVQRLLHVAETSPALASQALTLALDAVEKESINVVAYRRLTDAAAALGVTRIA